MMNHWVTEQEMEEFRQRYVPDVLLVPLSAFFNTYRLGYGGGYYDRYLANHPEIITIGVAFDERNGLLSNALGSGTRLYSDSNQNHRKETK